jgi:prolyl-tRNA synthetase
MITTTDYDAFKQLLDARKIVIAHHCGEAECEEAIKADTLGATSRCRPFEKDQAEKGASCVRCGAPAAYRIFFSRNY